MELIMFYENTLYQLQDKILKIIDNLNTGFYLTGGTALSRFYFNHRYSNDIDLFVNNDLKFHDYMKDIFKSFATHNINYNVEKRDETFYRLTLENILKADFVNDVPAYCGTIQIREEGPYSKIDNPINILANKINAFYDREEAKDIVDIWIITKNIQVDWKKIFTSINSKAVGINVPLVAKKLEEFNIINLDKIKWIKRPSNDEFKRDIEKVINNILFSE